MTTLPGLGKTGQQILNASATTSETHSNGWEQLPPLPEIIDGVDQFTRHSFQLGFIPKKQFRQHLVNDHSSVSAFLVASILSISARLSRPLSARYGSGIKASEFFMERATKLALGEIYPPKNTLENCQAFYLLSMAQKVNGLKNESYMSMGLALRIAIAIKLHLEQAYVYETSDPTPAAIILRESARRTLWMLHSQDHLQSSTSSPASLVASDITTLLPCDEDQFAAGQEPPSRAAFEGTQPARENPDLVNENRSLFGSLIQAYGFWGVVKRHGVNNLSNSYPWDPESEFAKLLRKLDHWESSLPPAHKWSEARLREYETKAQDLAYLEVTMIPRLCRIVFRYLYLRHFPSSALAYRQNARFFKEVEGDLFDNVCSLHDLIDAQFTGHFTQERLGGLMAALCVYVSSATVATDYTLSIDYFVEPDVPFQNRLCNMWNRCLNILAGYKEAWPLTSRWFHALRDSGPDSSSSFSSKNGSAVDKHSFPHQTTSCPATMLISFGELPDSSSGNQKEIHGEISTIFQNFQSPTEQHLPIQRMPTNPQTHQQQPWDIPPGQAFDLNQDGSQPMVDYGMLLEGFNLNHADNYLLAPQAIPPLVTDMSMAMEISVESAPGGFAGNMTHPSWNAQGWTLLSDDFGGH
ncbi:hypothetical protein FANTH_1921 [Fusarium anthophilum]|uniref:Xylanolytic transcriptional activator regulatory domain-containing protein n=1 Tax=Fusarium anthophilum TaxID=48485 RepID=A0A8H4ZUR1_9HYPO|nr:hypothetical protein FANTH_1921 [Fusarium anthophilum]